MQTQKQAATYGKLSLLSTVITLFLASVSHAYFFGHKAFVAGAGFIFIITALYFIYKRYENKLVLFFYFLLNALVIIGFGIINGFWNHLIKVALTYLHGGKLPPVFTGLFQNAETGTFFQETVGALTFIASMFSAYYGLKIIRKKQ